jgi:hypothetical protein
MITIIILKPDSKVDQEQSLGHGLGGSAWVDLFFSKKIKAT